METINDSIAAAMGSVRPEKPMHVPTASDCMTTSLITFRPTQSIKEAVALLLKHKVSGAPVLGEARMLVGMLSEMDCVRALAAGAYSGDLFGRGRFVSDLMTRRCITVDPHTDIYAMAHLFDQHAIRRLPVVDDGVLVGQVSRRDILRAIQKLY